VGQFPDEEGMEVLDISSPSPSSYSSLSNRRHETLPTYSAPTYQELPGQYHGRSGSGGFLNFLRLVWDAKDSRQIVIYFILRLVFALVALFTGSYSNSVGLSCLAFHAVFECVGLGVEIWANTAAKHWNTTSGGFSFGFHRLGVLSGFGNAVFLLFVSLFTLEHAVEHLFEVPVVLSGPVMTVAIAGCILNLVGLLIMQSSKSEKKTALRGEVLWARLLADNLASFGVIIAAFLSQFGFLAADSIVAAVISIIVIFTTIPLAKETAQVLLLASPNHLNDTLTNCLGEVGRLDHVLHCDKVHFWTLSTGHVVGTLHVEISAEGNEQEILSKVQRIFSSYVNSLTVQINRNDWKVHSQLRDHE